MSIQLKDGGVYARADGSEYEVYYDAIDINRPWRHHMGAAYTDDGYYYDSGDASNLDLIRVVSEPETPVPEVMSIQLKDGGVYARADGTESKIRHRGNYHTRPWIDNFGSTFYDCGRWSKYGGGSFIDLIRVVSEPDESVPEVVVTEYTVKEVVRLKKEIDDWIRLYKSMNTRDFLAEIATLEADRDEWKKACLAWIDLRHSALKEAAGWRKICEGHALRLEALGEKP
jgi:hypothetical protein